MQYATTLDPISISSSQSRNETHLLNVPAYFLESGCVKRSHCPALSPVLDRLHEMAEGVTTR